MILAGLINACALTKRSLATSKIVIAGAGAAGIASAQLLENYGARHIVLLDSRGAIYDQRDGLTPHKSALAHLNIDQAQGSLSEVIA